jgi:hypothetical protein
MTYVDCQLGRVGARNEVGGSEQIEKLFPGQPLPAADDFILHHCDVGGWSAECDGPQLQE